MPIKFSDFMREIEDEAKREGPEAVTQLEDLRKHFKKKRLMEEIGGWEIAPRYFKRIIYLDLFWWSCLLVSYAFLIRGIIEI